MTITTGNTTIEYSVTPNGQYTEKVTGPKGTILRSTPSVGKFLAWLLRREIESDEFQVSVLRMSTWWELKGNDQIRGSFDVELYKRVIVAKQWRNQR